MKRLTVSPKIALLLGVSMMFSGAVWAETEGFTVAGQVSFPKTGNVYLSLVTAEHCAEDEDEDEIPFLEQSAVAKAILTISEDDRENGTVAFEFTNIPAGTYAIRGFQDVNGNEMLDEGAWGPKEPWGNYRLARPRMRAPKFEEMQFEVTQDMTDLEFELK